MHTDGSGTLSFDWADRVIVLARNSSGVTINEGDPVYITGYNSGQERVEVSAADAASSATMPAMGLAAETMLNNSNGTVIISGFLEDGDTSVYSVGDSLYVAAGGGLTATKPTGTNLIQNIAFVLEAAVNGTLAVLSPGRTNDVPNLAQDTAWHGSTSGTAVASTTPRTLGWKALEQSTTPATAVTEGTYWVKDDGPTTPWFTDSTNAPHQLAYSASPLAGIADSDGDFLVGTGSGWVVETGDTARTSLGLGTGDHPAFALLDVTGGKMTMTSGFSIEWEDTAIQRGRMWVNTGGDMFLDADNTIKLYPGGAEEAFFRVGGGMQLVESAAAPSDVAGRGTWWVKNDIPNTPWFTDDSGVDYQLAYTTTPLAGIADLDGDFLVGTGSGWVVETGDTARVSLGVGTTDTPSWAGITVSGLGASIAFSGESAGTSQFIDFGTGGFAAPSFTTRSIGAKLVIYDYLTAARADWAIGMMSQHMWFGVPENTVNQGFKFYGGEDEAALLTGSGELLIRQQLTMDELAAPRNVGAGKGAFWVMNDAPATPHFLDDASGDHQLQYQADGLDDIGALALTDGNIIVGDGTNWVAESGNVARTSLGLGTADSPSFSTTTLTGTGAVLNINGATKHIDFNTGGIGAPTVTTVSAGTKLLLWDNIGATMVGHGIGLETNHTWFSVATDIVNQGFNFYSGLSKVASIRGAGDGLELLETSALGINPAAGYGRFWVKNDTPNVPMFSDDGATANQLQYQSAALDDLAALTPTDSNIIVGDGTNWIVETGDTARVSLGVGTTDSPTWTSATLTATGEALSLSGTNKWITFETGGSAAPTFTTRSTGTKLVLWEGLSAAAAGYAIGMMSANLWLGTSADAATHGIHFYGGDSRTASIRGAGDGLELLETTALGLNPSAGFGRYWVRDDAPNTPMFTDDAGTDFRLGQRGLGQLREPCTVATQSNVADLAAGAPDTVDGQALTVGMRILVKEQTAGAENGIYIVDTVGTGANGTWSRADDWSDGIEDRLAFGVTTIIVQGTISQGTLYTLVTAGAIVVGTTSISFESVLLFGGSSMGTTDNTLLRSKGTEGGSVQGSGVLLDDNENFTGVLSVQMGEASALALTPAAGAGAFWVKDDAPTTPQFTDDAGTDHQLAYAADVTTVTTYKDPCRVATDTNITLAGGAPDTVGGVTLVANDRVLVPNQTSGSQNGIYYVSTLGTGANGTWTRDEDFNDVATDNIQAGVISYVQEGDHARARYTLITTGTIVLDTTVLEFIEEAPIMRSDAAGTDVLGSSGSPQTLAVADTWYTEASTTTTRDHRDAIWYTTIANKGTATKITVKVEWLEDGTNLGPQGTEAISSGTATLSVYEAEYDISALTAPFNLPTISLPTAGPAAKVSVKADIGTTATCYVRVWRKA